MSVDNMTLDLDSSAVVIIMDYEADNSSAVQAIIDAYVSNCSMIVGSIVNSDLVSDIVSGDPFIEYGWVSNHTVVLSPSIVEGVGEFVVACDGLIRIGNDTIAELPELSVVVEVV